MEAFSITALAVVWSRGPLRCFYCKRANNQAWVVLYYAGEAILKRRVFSIEEMRDTAMSWKEAMDADFPPTARLAVAPKRDRRQLSDRRRVFRGSRRASDLRR